LPGEQWIPVQQPAIHSSMEPFERMPFGHDGVQIVIWKRKLVQIDEFLRDTYGLETAQM
jgi:hypothetical protein